MSKLLNGYLYVTPEEAQKMMEELLKKSVLWPVDQKPATWLGYPVKIVPSLKKLDGAVKLTTEEVLKFAKGVESMALKVKDSPKTGVDYGQHLGGHTHQTKPIVGSVSSETKEGKGEWKGSQGETQTVHPGVVTNGMQISVAGGRTINLGNYESARIDVSITVPCDKETLNDAYEYATGWVSEKIEEAVKQAKGA